MLEKILGLTANPPSFPTWIKGWRSSLLRLRNCFSWLYGLCCRRGILQVPPLLLPGAANATLFSRGSAIQLNQKRCFVSIRIHLQFTRVFTAKVRQHGAIPAGAATQSSNSKGNFLRKHKHKSTANSKYKSSSVPLGKKIPVFFFSSRRSVFHCSVQPSFFSFFSPC